MVREPKLFLMDEPLSNLDAKLRDTMSAQIKALHEMLHVTLIYVTHDQVEAMTMADRVVILDKGEIQQVGSPFEIYHKPQNLFVAQFIGRPSMNLFRCQKIDSGILLQEVIALQVQKPYLEESKIYHLGLRSEHIEVGTEKETHLEATIQKVDYLGSETLLYLTYENCCFTAKHYQDTLFKIGEQVKVHFNLDRAHYFNDKQERISGGK